MIELAEGQSSLFVSDLIERGKRDGIEIEKGAVLNEDWLEANFEEIGKICNIFAAYPDIYLDIIKPADSNFELFFYQRIFLRAIMRYKIIYVTACRAFSKSFITILGNVIIVYIYAWHQTLYLCS